MSKIVHELLHMAAMIVKRKNHERFLLYHLTFNFIHFCSLMESLKNEINFYMFILNVGCANKMFKIFIWNTMIKTLCGMYVSFVSFLFAVLFALKLVDRLKSYCINARMFADSTCLWSRSALQSKNLTWIRAGKIPF